MNLTVSPPSPACQGVARIEITGDSLACTFPVKDDAFRKIMKSHDLAWEYPRWRRTVGVRAGSITDRAAEIGRALLSAGFVVHFPDTASRDKAVSGDFEPEQRHWVVRITDGQYKDWFLIRWERYGKTDWYHRAMRLDGARYSPPFVAVPGEMYAEVLDFARLNGFSLSSGAQALAAEKQQERADWLVMEIAEKPAKPPAKAAESDSTEIAHELLDEPL